MLKFSQEKPQTNSCKIHWTENNHINYKEMLMKYFDKKK